MAKNELVVGEPRLGWFVDGNPDTEQIAVMLQDTGSAIELTIPLKGMFADEDPYGRWWSSGTQFMDDLDRTKHSYGPPRVLVMHDNSGPVVLVGCRSAGSTMSFRVGQGRIVANFAVLGGQTLAYEKIHGLRTEIPALAAWTRLSSMEVKVTTNDKRRVQAVQMTLADAPEVQLTRALNLKMKSSWRTENPRGRFLAYEGVKLETIATKPRTWDEHLNLHGAVLELISLAAWRSFGFASVEVNRADDPTRDLAQESMGEKWSDVATHRLPKHEEWTKDPQFLFPYAEIGPGGIAKWLKLRKDYGQAVGPLLGILRADDRWSHASVVQSGISLEALGYLIDVNKNGSTHLNSRKQMNFKPGLQVILDDMAVKPFADTADWIGRADNAYMGAKHPDRPEQDSLVMLNTLRQNILVLRYWIAQQLGATETSLNDRIRTDPLAHEFTLIG
jgi:hypothetical protein